MSKYFVEPGSIYAPGWHVRERVRDNLLRSVACFDEKADAEEYLAFIQGEETSLLEALRANPLPHEWVNELRELLDLMSDFTDNDQRSRFLLNCNFLRDHGARIAERIQLLDRSANAEVTS